LADIEKLYESCKRIMGEGQQLRDRDTRAIGLDLRKKEKGGPDLG
jgi:hypothetical protein